MDRYDVSTTLVGSGFTGATFDALTSLADIVMAELRVTSAPCVTTRRAPAGGWTGAEPISAVRASEER